MFGSRGTTQAVGRAGEEIALGHLRILETGFRFLRGEIDIIARDRSTLVFIEVKKRTGTRFGRPAEAVTPAKQRQIRKVAEGYLLMRRLGDVPCRFDVISIGPDRRGGDVVEHFKNAF